MHYSTVDGPLYDCRIEHRLSGRTLHNYECQHATLAEAKAHAERLMSRSERGRNVVVRLNERDGRP